MNKTKFEYENKHHILEFNGVEYPIPYRTTTIEEQLNKRDEEINKTDEFENNIKVLEILFGEDVAKQMFPDKKTTNLDELFECTTVAIALYRAEIERIKNKTHSSSIQELNNVIDKLNNIANTKKSQQNIVNIQHKHRKRK